MTRATPTKEQTLAALSRVSRGQVWNATPVPSDWRSVGEVAADLVARNIEAAE